MLAWIRRARRFRHLDSAERRLVLEAALFMLAVRLALSALSLRTLRGLLARIPAAARPLPAVGVHTLLGRRGQSAHLRPGFVKSEGGVLRRHAWVESAGRVFGDTGKASCYTPAPDFAGQRL